MGPPIPSIYQRSVQNILGWYHTQELCSKCENKKKVGEKHICPACKSTCKKCKHTGHYDLHCFANWKAPTETHNLSRQGFNEADYAGLQVDLPSDFSDAESDTLYATAMSAARGQQQRN
jgi:hypothetical protein